MENNFFKHAFQILAVRLIIKNGGRVVHYRASRMQPLFIGIFTFLLATNIVGMSSSTSAIFGLATSIAFYTIATILAGYINNLQIANLMRRRSFCDETVRVGHEM